MATSHRDLDFSFWQGLIMLRVKYFKLSKKLAHQKHRYHFLIQYSLIDYHHKNHDYYALNEKAKMYLRYKVKDRIRFWVPVIISIIALFGGYDVYTIPLLERFLQAIATIVKTILESLGAVF